MTITTTPASHATLGDVLRLAQIAEVVGKGGRVAFVDEDGNVSRGTARHFVVGPDNFGFLRANEDVFSAFLRVTMQSGVERAEPVSELVFRLDDTFFLNA